MQAQKIQGGKNATSGGKRLNDTIPQKDFDVNLSIYFTNLRFSKHFLRSFYTHTHTHIYVYISVE